MICFGYISSLVCVVFKLFLSKSLAQGGTAHDGNFEGNLETPLKTVLF